MTRNNDDHLEGEDGLLPGYDANPVGNNQRHEPRFSSFNEDDEEEFEEPDRDTDYASGFSADSVDEEEEFEDEFSDEEERDFLSADDDDAGYQPSSARREPEQSVAEEPDAWLEEEGDLEEEEDGGQKWPLGLIAVAIVALVLLTAGGYGVMQQRAATEEELRQLRAALATTASPEEVKTSREALQNMQQSHDKLSANAAALTLENRRLADTVASLQAQLGVQQAVLTTTVPATNPAKPPVAEAVASLYGTKTTPTTNQGKPATTGETSSPPPASLQPTAPVPITSNPATTQSAPTGSSGPWFVNFGSYKSRSMAESWASRLHPGEGKVIIAPSAKDGQTLYRLRVVGLPSRSSAEEVARKLEGELRVSQLWVGRE